MKKVLFSICAICLLPSISYAHLMGGGGFVDGLTHPVLGYDHLLAMLSVGILSAQIGGRAIWTVPTTFVAVMAIGGILGLYNIPFIFIEDGIALSVFALGIVIALDQKLPNIVAMIFVGFFAIFHGYAHGAEMPVIVNPILYVLGFMIGTAAIHIMGVIIGYIATKTEWSSNLLRAFGGIFGMIGLGFLFGVV